MRIGELADATAMTTKALRFYEAQGLLMTADRTPSGYRDYNPDVVGRVLFIRRGQAAGLTLAQIRQILDIRDRGNAPCGHVREVLDARLVDLELQIKQLAELRTAITQLRDQAEALEPETCTAGQICRYL